MHFCNQPAICRQNYKVIGGPFCLILLNYCTVYVEGNSCCSATKNVAGTEALENWNNFNYENNLQ